MPIQKTEIELNAVNKPVSHVPKPWLEKRSKLKAKRRRISISPVLLRWSRTLPYPIDRSLDCGGEPGALI
jgi:hypothetical protein